MRRAMLIGLDARTIYRRHRRGTGKNLIDLYRHVALLRPDWRVLAYHRPGELAAGEAGALLPAPVVQPRAIDMPGDRLHAWERCRLPFSAWRAGCDLMHCPANTAPSWMPVPTMVTIHDLIPLDLPEGRSAGDVRHFERSVRLACRRAAWLICPSRYTADRLVRQFGADPARLTVNPWAPDSAVGRVAPEQWQQVLDRYGVPAPFVLHLGSAAPRKNTRRVLEAWAMLDSAIRRSWRLLVVGLDEQAQRQFGSLVARLGIGNSVVLHGFADEQDLPALLRGAGALAYPSLSEGFGLPLLDAWAVGTPVLTSHVTSLPEVAGEAALLVDPTDSCAIARGLARMLRDHRCRQDLVERGTARVTQFTWQATAQRFVEAVERAAAAVGAAAVAEAA